MCDRPSENAYVDSRMIVFLQPQYTAPDTVGVVSPWADDLVAFWSRVGQERRNLGDNDAPSHQDLDSRTRTEQISTRSRRLTPKTTRTIKPNGKSRIISHAICAVPVTTLHCLPQTRLRTQWRELERTVYRIVDPSLVIMMLYDYEWHEGW